MTTLSTGHIRGHRRIQESIWNTKFAPGKTRKFMQFDETIVNSRDHAPLTEDRLVPMSDSENRDQSADPEFRHSQSTPAS